MRLVWRGFGALERTVEASNQLAIRITVLLVFGLLTLAAELGLDILLGGFVAGMIARAALRGRELEQFESKLTAVGFGFPIPFFFVESGLTFDLDALGSASALLKLGLFFALFLVVRGAPAMLLYRGVLGLRERSALAVFCATELPLVVAITSLATAAGEMSSSTAAGSSAPRSSRPSSTRSSAQPCGARMASPPARTRRRRQGPMPEPTTG